MGLGAAKDKAGEGSRDHVRCAVATAGVMVTNNTGKPLKVCKRRGNRVTLSLWDDDWALPQGTGQGVYCIWSQYLFEERYAYLSKISFLWYRLASHIIKQNCFPLPLEK